MAKFSIRLRKEYDKVILNTGCDYNNIITVAEDSQGLRLSLTEQSLTGQHIKRWTGLSVNLNLKLDPHKNRSIVVERR